MICRLNHIKRALTHDGFTVEVDRLPGLVVIHRAREPGFHYLLKRRWYFQPWVKFQLRLEFHTNNNLK